ncbi:CRISPR-associated helicase/endonuclease Cas3 [Dactylosporangium fulvum]|uniref:CRISPR-associated helicase Cas3 n=1 Tax=Dactylosporangium fulvum TaxID=53359 RepID=A0ABY5WBA7_9ACTN|nr:CRISPR-associated helicase Cas3' [Dactylosporangium fulvum]UWP86640.1 CRISPR-associated helicase Cas3' [Dactylosporangium fulvum]
MWAHSKNRFGIRHRLEDHLRGTAELARRFALPFGMGELAWWAGLVHDGGKCWQDWQDKLLLVEPTNGRVGLDHKSFGVQLARRHGLKPVEFAVAGHHGGLTNRGKVDDLFGEDDAYEQWLRRGPWADAERRLRVAMPEMFSRVPPLPGEFGADGDKMVQEFLLRFLFSCLVDADVLDTQAHRENTAPRVGPDLDAPAVLERFLTRRADYLSKRPPGSMDARRERVFAVAMAAAERAPGIFRLTAPTGTAKTIAAAGFALKHAALHGKRRVIVVVPFITITEQNAAVYRALLDPDDPDGVPVVLEHHSHVEMTEPGTGDQHHSWQRLAAENWDAPFVVTTTVQLFESLFGRTQSRMRKLHRIANSVLVLDEVQALPHRLLPQIADALRILSERFGVTVVLSSATQPAVHALGPLKDLRAYEMLPEPAAFFAECQRVRFEWRLDSKPALGEMVTEAAVYPQALMVVNTVRDARTAFEQARQDSPDGAGVLHLSTGMCPAHRQRVLATVRRLLRHGEPVLLVSTSLVEAGVDLDFPVAFRAVGPPESMAQVAGRCNREGNLGDRGGLVVIFGPADGGLPPSYPTQIHKALVHFGPDKAEPEDQAALAAYFPELYRTLGIEDRGSPAKVIASNRRKWDFIAVADGPLKSPGGTQRDRERAFRMITDDTVPVLVPYGDAAARRTVQQCLNRLRGPQPDMSTLRQLQPYITTLRRRTTQRADIAANLDPVIGDLLLWRGDYDDGYGIVLEPRDEDYLL